MDWLMVTARLTVRTDTDAALEAAETGDTKALMQLEAQLDRQLDAIRAAGP